MFSRRNFLKALGIGAGAAAVGVALPKSEPMAELEAVSVPSVWTEKPIVTPYVMTTTTGTSIPGSFTIWQRTDGTYTTDRALLSMWSK